MFAAKTSRTSAVSPMHLGSNHHVGEIREGSSQDAGLMSVFAPQTACQPWCIPPLHLLLRQPAVILLNKQRRHREPREKSTHLLDKSNAFASQKMRSKCNTQITRDHWRNRPIQEKKLDMLHYINNINNCYPSSASLMRAVYIAGSGEGQLYLNAT